MPNIHFPMLPPISSGPLGANPRQQPPGTTLQTPGPKPPPVLYGGPQSPPKPPPSGGIGPAPTLPPPGWGGEMPPTQPPPGTGTGSANMGGAPPPTTGPVPPPPVGVTPPGRRQLGPPISFGGGPPPYTGLPPAPDGSQPPPGYGVNGAFTPNAPPVGTPTIVGDSNGPGRRPLGPPGTGNMAPAPGGASMVDRKRKILPPDRRTSFPIR